jgi:hypothetical protein
MEAILFAMFAAVQDVQVKSPEPAIPAEKVVCRKIEVTGSRLAVRRLCLTEREWAQRTQDDIDATKDMQKPSRLPE